MSKIKYFILQHIFPGFYAAYANGIVSKNQQNQKGFDVDLTAITTEQEKEYIDQVKADLKEQHDRKKIIEDKAKSLLFILAVSITAITFSLTYLKSIYFNVYQIIALIFLGTSISYFISGVIRALQTLNIRPFNVIQAEVEITDSSYKLIARKNDNDFLKVLIKKKQLNDLTNVCLANYTYASFSLIRNAIIFFVMFFVTTIYGNYFSQKGKTKDTYPINKEIQMRINDSIDVKIPYTFELEYSIQNLEIDKKEKE